MFTLRPVALLCALICTLNVAVADVPRLFNYQGKLAGYGDETVSLNVNIWSTPTGGTALFAETHPNVALRDGVFSIRVGAMSVNGVPTSVAVPPLWISIAVDGGSELLPRTRLVSVPFSYRALGADVLLVPDSTTVAASVSTAGNVGVNETDPLARLHVTATSGVANLSASHLGGETFVLESSPAWLGLYSSETGPAVAGITLGEINSSNGSLTKWALVKRTATGLDDFSITYGSNVDANQNTRHLQIKPSGDIAIGLGNTAPSARLHVKASGSVENDAPASARFVSEYPTASGSTSEYIQFQGDEIFAKKDGNNTTLGLQYDGGQVRIGTFGSLVDDPVLTVSRNAGLLSNDNLEFEDVFIHDTNQAWLGLYSDSVGNLASGITFGEYGITPAKWAVFARTAANDGDLNFTFGYDVNPSANQKLLQMKPDGRVVVPGVNDEPSIVLDGLESNGNGKIELYNAAGQRTVKLDGDDDADAGSFMVFYNAAGAETVRITADDANSDGRVITEVLEITGGSDFSENFEVNHPTPTIGAASDPTLDPQPGMVVCIDTQRPGELVVSTKAHDRTVAGIISGAGGVKPGLLMGQRSSIADGRHPVALTGRVYVLCDAAYGSIQPGDLLTTSNTIGHAMRVGDPTAAQGATIGKAMTSLESGRGLVLVLVSLQ